MIAYFISLWTRTALRDYFKAAEFSGGFAPTRLLLANESSHLRVLDRSPESFQLFAYPFGDQFDPPPRKVPHRARNLTSHRCHFHRITKSDALHPARIENV